MQLNSYENSVADFLYFVNILGIRILLKKSTELVEFFIMWT
jgi:hypothetical protein